MPPLPPRVIHVGSSCADAYLYLSSPGERGRYVALSHCWGGVSPLITTLSCFDRFQIALPQPIPQTFADAMDVTRRLGYKYLWIDSLCIIQDFAADWGKHATRMNYIYSQAQLTISADGAQDSLAGFLHPQNKRRETVAVKCKTFTADHLREERTHTIHVRQRGKLACQLPYHDFFPGYPWERYSSASVHDSSPADSPQVWDPNFRTMRSKLSTRAWAFQERLLSPRTLHFAPSEMAWECRSICSCECSATNEPRAILAGSLLKGSKALDLAPVDETDPQSAYNVEAAWRRDIVEEFTRLDLTRPTDRLPALAGLAARAAKSRPGDQYMAGVWRRSLAADLLWHITGERASHRIVCDNMPTWSWASVTGEAHYPLQRYSLAWYNRRDPEPSTLPLMRVLRTQYTAKSESLFASGPRLPASITLWGYLLKINSLRRLSTYQYEIQWPAGIDLHPNTVVAADVHCGNSTNEDTCTGETSSHDNISEALSKQRDLFVLVGYIDKGEVFGLLLARCPSRRSVIPSFERIGCVNGTFNERETFLERRSNGIVDFGPTDEWADQKVTHSKSASFLGGRGKSLLKIW
ncbi:het domain-containing protein [Colletotrichum kahawae]|uniref:Het domain-containing protein n=1 Tax=Colletotrichum kahawae TaxID=34407 RepID=A0AAE0DDN1_COLKA|nr:het domain-containing protein [Colletotrichum kahawae]